MQPMTRSLEQAADRLRARVFRAVFLGGLARYAMWTLFACGTVALLLRYVLRLERTDVLWAFAPLVLVPFAALWVARRKQLSRAGAVAWLDVRSDAGGALLTRLDVDDDAWTERVEVALARSVELPRARVARPALQTFPALAFALAALFVEMPRDPVLPPRALEEAAVARVEEQLETLKEEVALEPELAAELEARMERLQEEGGTPEEAFEAIDSLQERLAQEGDELGEEIREAQEALTAAAETAPADPAAAQEALEKTLAELTKSGLNKHLPEELKSELGMDSLELPPGTKLEPMELEKLSKGLSEALAGKLDRLGKAGLLKPGKLGKGGKLANLDDFEPTGHVCTEECGKKPGGT
jgi:hypothetical protein